MQHTQHSTITFKCIWKNAIFDTAFHKLPIFYVNQNPGEAWSQVPHNK